MGDRGWGEGGSGIVHIHYKYKYKYHFSSIMIPLVRCKRSCKRTKKQSIGMFLTTKNTRIIYSFDMLR